MSKLFHFWVLLHVNKPKAEKNTLCYWKKKIPCVYFLAVLTAAWTAQNRYKTDKANSKIDKHPLFPSWPPAQKLRHQSETAKKFQGQNLKAMQTHVSSYIPLSILKMWSKSKPVRSKVKLGLTVLPQWRMWHLKIGIDLAHIKKYPFSHMRKLKWAFSKIKIMQQDNYQSYLQINWQHSNTF